MIRYTTGRFSSLCRLLKRCVRIWSSMFQTQLCYYFLRCFQYFLMMRLLLCLVHSLFVYFQRSSWHLLVLLLPHLAYLKKKKSIQTFYRQIIFFVTLKHPLLFHSKELIWQNFILLREKIRCKCRVYVRQGWNVHTDSDLRKRCP